jgi:stringent starvation protein B
MRSNRPYLFKAFYEWIVDSECTPYIAVDAHYPGVEVPQEFVNDGQIVLNIAPRAVSNFQLQCDHLHLSTRFGGIPIDIHVPLQGIICIYAHENGRGMVFDPEEPQDDPTPPQGPTAVSSQQSEKKPVKKSSKSENKPSLRVVK